jgi:hypothetical protein
MKKYLFLSVLILSLISCSKEKRIERQLDGSWNIEEYLSSGYNLDGSSSYDTTVYNFGTFEFDKSSNKGSTSTIFDGQTEETNFNYSITEDGKTINIKSEDGSNVKFNILNYDKKKSMELYNLSTDSKSSTTLIFKLKYRY